MVFSPSLLLLFTTEIMTLIVNMTNLNGQCTTNEWIDTNDLEMKAYIGLLLLAGVFNCRGEDARSLWNDRTGRAIFRATMSLKRFRQLSSKLRFDDRLQRLARHRALAPIHADTVVGGLYHGLVRPYLINDDGDDGVGCPLSHKCKVLVGHENMILVHLAT